LKRSAPVIPELLAPAGSYEKLLTAIHYGADAVYLSGKHYGLRAKAGNFTSEQIDQAVAYAHERDVRVYVTVNIIAHNEDFQNLESFLLRLDKIGVDAIIVSDPGIIGLARQLVPELPIHLSTQANVTNAHAAKFWMNQGVGRINLARELSLAEIAMLRDEVDTELEAFVHGALCISYSGRCMLSNYMTGRDANRGNCAQPCRYSYALMEEKRPGEYFPVLEDERGTYIFNSKDLCLLPHLPALVAAGVDSLKIEGRMKSIFYVGGVVRVYRAALDYLRDLDPKVWDEPAQIRIPEHFFDEIARTGTRGMSDNFASNKPAEGAMLYNSSRIDQSHEPVAVVQAADRADAEIEVEIRNVLLPGERIEYMGRSVESPTVVVESMHDLQGEPLRRANPSERVLLRLSEALEGLEPNDMFRRQKKPAQQ
jgi:putative protease